MCIDVEWDFAKAESNRRKHGVGFDEAVSALLDPFALAQEDERSAGEPRWLLLGMTARQRLVVVVYTLRREETIRVISARTATKSEAIWYAHA